MHINFSLELQSGTFPFGQYAPFVHCGFPEVELVQAHVQVCWFTSQPKGQRRLHPEVEFDTQCAHEEHVCGT